jgi:hypothetical protein
MGAQPNVLGSQQIGGTGMGPPYGVYIQQAVQQTLPMHQVSIIFLSTVFLLFLNLVLFLLTIDKMQY